MDLKDNQDQQATLQPEEEKPYYLTKEEKEAMLKEVRESLDFADKHWDEIN